MSAGRRPSSTTGSKAERELEHAFTGVVYQGAYRGRMSLALSVQRQKRLIGRRVLTRLGQVQQRQQAFPITLDLVLDGSQGQVRRGTGKDDFFVSALSVPLQQVFADPSPARSARPQFPGPLDLSARLT